MSDVFHVCVRANICARLCVCARALSFYKEHGAACVFTLENIGDTKKVREKGRPASRKPEGRRCGWGDGGEGCLLPDTEVCAAGVIASDRGHSACVGAYVT